MRKLYLFSVLVFMLLMLTGTTMADWFPGDGHKMHYAQMPDEAGWDVNATQPLVLADDWMCGETGWVKDIHFWGSWMHGIEGQIISFNLSIHADIPADPPAIPYSRPGPTLWEREIIDFIPLPIDAPTAEGWYDPSTGLFLLDDHFTYFQYNVFLPEEDWFWQDQGTIYWLNISATLVDPAGTQWGWKSSLDHWNDDAVWGLWGDLNWIDMWEPPDFFQSMDLSFVINGGVEEEPEACCLQDGNCVMALPADCINSLGGTPQGPGTVCGTPEACCLGDGTCVMADPICCDELGGTPQGPGTVCSTPEGCCMPDGTCQNLDPLCCVDLSGVPQGPGTLCTQTQACCLPGGGCTDVDPLCCDEMGGWVSPTGAPFCMGDGNGNGVDDACDVLTGACCLDDGSCVDLTMADCNAIPNSVYMGDGSRCLGDNNNNGVNDACENWMPDDGHKMHYPQLPNIQGWGVDATYPVVLADDWMCGETGWVKDIHFWGAYQFGGVGRVERFVLSIHADVPAGVDQPYSHPGDLLWEYETDYFSETPFDMETPEGWYSSMLEWFAFDDHIGLYQYNIYLPEEFWFWQDEGTIYWLNITAIFANPEGTGRWGWKSSIEHWNDDAVWGLYEGYECSAPDNGIESVDLPVFCPFLTGEDPPEIIDGLPPGTTIECELAIDGFHNILRTPGGNLGGEIQQFEAVMEATLTGTGSLAGFTRTISIPAVMETHSGPLNPGDPLQIADYELVLMSGEVVGDPDFDYLSISMSSGLGFPSDGEIKIRESDDNPDWWVESFFDVGYRIEFNGAPGSILDGLMGLTYGPGDLTQGAAIQFWIDLYEPPDFIQSLDLAFVITGEADQQCDCLPGDASGNITINILDVTHIINYLYKSGPAPSPYALCSGDADCNCQVNILDVTYLINYLYKGGPPPCTCAQWLINCGPPLRK